jgi:hypothetical protein
MAVLRKTLFALFALIAACSAVAAQAAPVAMPVPVDQPAIHHACMCDAGCDTAACMTMTSCAQSCVSVAAFLGVAGQALNPPALSAARMNDSYRAYTAAAWPPPLHPPKT